MERWYTTKMTYVGATLPATSCRTDLANQYTFQFPTAVTASAFTIQAVPQGSQAGDTRCGTLAINQVGARTETGTSTAADCW